MNDHLCACGVLNCLCGKYMVIVPVGQKNVFKLVFKAAYLFHKAFVSKGSVHKGHIPAVIVGHEITFVIHISDRKCFNRHSISFLGFFAAQ